MELSLIVPCYNEALNVAALASRVGRVIDESALAGTELILVDDGSRDDTWARIEEARREHGFIVGARHDGNRGLTAAWRTGVTRASGRLVCILDADLQYRPEDVPRLLRALRESGADIVQGWRSRTGASRDARWFMSRGLNVILNRTFGMRLRDNKSGFILCRREVFADLLDHRGRYRYWQVLLLVAAHAKGYRVHEIETPFDERHAGRSFLPPLPVATALRVVLDIGRGVLEYRLGLG